MLGRLPTEYDYRTLMGAKYVKAVSPPPPVEDHMSNPNLTVDMALNNQIGDCTIASYDHLTCMWTFNVNGIEVHLTNDQILKAYSDVSGYDPITGQNDNGAVMLVVCKYLKNTGVGGHKVAAFVSLDVNDLEQIKLSIHIFGGVYFGWDVAQFALDQFNAGQSWTIPSVLTNQQRRIVGGHAVGLGQYDQNRVRCFSWAQKQSWP